MADEKKDTTEGSKSCSRCQRTKPLAEFHRNGRALDGRTPACGRCRNQTSRRRYATNPEPRKAEGRATFARNRERNKRRARERYAATPKKVRRARYLVGNAIRDGRITRQPCETCGKEPAQAHHDDYDKPLAVRWLCPQHHHDWHREHRIQSSW